MSLKTIAGKLLRTAGNKLALFCECCIRYCCVEFGPEDECGNREQQCQPCPGGPKPSCAEPCPERPPCLLQCVEVAVTACDDPVYECVHDTKLVGIPVETCEECPEPPPCEGYYCCFETEPSQDPNSQWPIQSCQLGPCEGVELYSSGPHLTEIACNAVCKNYYCCYEYAPSEDPEAPLPPSFCQVGPCADPTLQAGGPYPTLAQCSCRCCKKTICHERVYSHYQVVLGSFDPLTNPCQPTPVNDPSALRISATTVICGGQSPGQFCTNDWGSRCAPVGDIDIGDVGTFNQYYERWRAVDDCSECVDTGGAFCTPGIALMNCWAWDDSPAWLQQALCECNQVESFCDNPLP